MQSPRRLAIVKAEIDAVIGLRDLDALVQWSKDVSHAPESRLLASGKARAVLEGFGEQRQRRAQGLSVADVAAITAGLDSPAWANPGYYCSLLESEAGAGRREVPLKDDGSFGDAPSIPAANGRG
jgi:hypothetical protein